MPGVIETLEACDSFADHRNKLRLIAAASNEYAGIPAGIECEELVVEKSYRFAALFNQSDVEETLPAGERIRNLFWSRRLRGDVCIFEKDSKFESVVIPGRNHLSQDLHTMGCSVAWGIEQEAQALQTLARLLTRHDKFKMYLLSGMFLEKSKRSGVMYCFRKLRPTIAMVEDEKTDTMRVLAALCMHPIAYYQGSWAGAMCPTDDVIAHLQLMRADEPMLWRRSNQHAPDQPGAGL